MTRPGRIVLAGVLLASLSAGAAEPESWQVVRPVIEAELAGGHIDDPQDLYKFLFQGVMGPGHAVPDAERARRWLDDEWKALDRRTADAAGDGPVVTTLRADGSLVRVHLQAALDSLRSGCLDSAEADEAAEGRLRRDILECFVATANEWEGDRDHVRELWRRIAGDEELWSGHFTAEACAEFTATVAAAGWPAVHHSKSYAERRRPHYRVVDAARWAATQRKTEPSR